LQLTSNIYRLNNVNINVTQTTLIDIIDDWWKSYFRFTETTE